VYLYVYIGIQHIKQLTGTIMLCMSEQKHFKFTSNRFFLFRMLEKHFKIR